MVGLVQEAVANALRNWDTLKSANVMPVRSTGGDSVVVNTPLPAIAVHVVGVEGEGYAFGRGIRQYFELTLHVLIEVNNFTFSKDGGAQAKALDLSDEVIRCMENSRLLDNLKQTRDFNRQYNRMETETTYGTKGALSVLVDVHKVVYSCDIDLDTSQKAFTDSVELKKINYEIRADGEEVKNLRLFSRGYLGDNEYLTEDSELLIP